MQCILGTSFQAERRVTVCSTIKAHGTVCARSYNRSGQALVVASTFVCTTLLSLFCELYDFAAAASHFCLLGEIEGEVKIHMSEDSVNIIFIVL